jgi:CheY-like chemotaxis protein
VLLVDDDPMVLISLTNMLELDGHHVDTAAGGQIGVEAFERSATQGRAHDVVITDFGMPHMNGREVARRVKRVAPSTVVILITGWGARAEASGQEPGDVDATLGKPPRLAQLRQALAGVPRP